METRLFDLRHSSKSRHRISNVGLNDLHLKIGKMGKEKPPILDFSTPREDKLIINLEFNNFFIINFLYKDSYLKHLIFQININNI